MRWFLREIKQNFIFSCSPTARSFGVAPKLRLLILSFCRSVKESIKESASERRQELPAGTGAAPLCQPLKCGADYRDATAALKIKHLRRLWGERLTFLSVAMMFRRKRRREEGLGRTLSMPPHRKSFCTTVQWQPPSGSILKKNDFSKSLPLHKSLFPFFYFEEIKERPSQGCEDEVRENFGV